MSQDKGSNLPEDLSRFLGDSGPADKFQQVILFTTTDAEGWPRHGMLSPYEVVARSTTRVLMLLYASSRSSQNLERDGRVSLIVVHPEMSYYVFCSARALPAIPEAPDETLFELEVQRVVEDTLPTARILSGITFEGYDPGMTAESRQAVFQKLRSM